MYRRKYKEDRCLNFIFIKGETVHPLNHHHRCSQCCFSFFPCCFLSPHKKIMNNELLNLFCFFFARWPFSNWTKIIINYLFKKCNKKNLKYTLHYVYLCENSIFLGSILISRVETRRNEFWQMFNILHISIHNYMHWKAKRFSWWLLNIFFLDFSQIYA